MTRIILVILFATFVQWAYSARILTVIPSPSYSHQIFFRPLWSELADRGHELVVITTDPTNDNYPNIKEISTKETYIPMKQIINMMVNSSVFDILLKNKWRDLSLDLYYTFFNIPAIQELINNKTEHFDLLIIEHYMSPMFGFKHRFNCSMIGVSSMDSLPLSHSVMGNPTHSVLYPASMFPYQENLSFLERLAVVVFGNIFNYLINNILGDLNQIGRDNFGQDMPSLQDIFEDTDMLFVNANPVFNAVRPHTPSTISIAGGMHIGTPKPLPEELKHFLDAAKEGVIYFSLGTNVMSNELSEKLQETIIATFSQLPYKILWKFENDVLSNKPDNVKITKWAPQQDVLRHKNIKLFINQGGLQSLEEALFANVPMVVIPFIADQKSNADKVKHKGLGQVLDWETLSVDEFNTTIQEVIKNPIYKETIKKLASQIQDVPMKAVEKAAWWTEYVLRHKQTKHLKGPRIPIYQYYYLDVFVFLGVVISLLLLSVYYVLKCVKRCICGTSAEKIKMQ